jgi:hypothetical protein
MSEEIKCHGDIAGRAGWSNPVWRPPQLQRTPYAEPFRSCSYCGSIHPQDLLFQLTGKVGVTMHGADWKYGWPHKFYVEGILNPIAGQIAEIGGASGGDIGENTSGAVWHNTCGHADCKDRTHSHGYWHVPTMEPAPQFTRAKFYNEHLKDCSDELFATLVPLLKQHTGIEWTLERATRPEFPPILRFKAPSPGYQQ